MSEKQPLVEAAPRSLTERDLIRAFTESFALSQGDPDLQKQFLQWFAHTYASAETTQVLSAMQPAAAIDAAVTLATTFIERGVHDPDDSLADGAEDMWSVFSKELVTPTIPEKEIPRIVREIFTGILMRDKKFLEAGGRPHANQEGAFRSFFIDFILLEAGSGYYSRKRFEALWQPLFTDLKPLALPTFREPMLAVIDLWKQKSNPTPGDVATVDAFLKNLEP